jgi:putative spermidine/putrescine transport system permease protein
MAQSASSFVNRRMIMDWLGIAPFMLFAALFPDPPDALSRDAAPFFNRSRRIHIPEFPRSLPADDRLAAYWISIKVSARHRPSADC